MVILGGPNYPLPPEREELPDAEQPLVSVVTPTTTSRHAIHAQLYACFDWQTYGNKELVVHDTGHRPSPFFEHLKDSRVLYVFQPGPLVGPPCSGRMTIGGKRKALVHLARGTILAQFDDDDIYVPNYLTRMVQALSSNDLVTLGSWFNCMGTPEPRCYEMVWYDGARLGDGERWGFGFSYVMRRSVALQVGYMHADWGEDYDFVMRAAMGSDGSSFWSEGRCYEAATCTSFADTMGSAVSLHMSHARNASKEPVIVATLGVKERRHRDLWEPGNAKRGPDGNVLGIGVLPGATIEDVVGPEFGPMVRALLDRTDWWAEELAPVAADVCSGGCGVAGIEG